MRPPDPASPTVRETIRTVTRLSPARLAAIVGVVALAMTPAFIAGFASGAFQYAQKGWPFRAPDPGAQLRAWAKADARLAETWTERLKKGGYIVYLRHAQRDKWNDVTAFDMFELATKEERPDKASWKRAVCLTDRGVEESKLIGQAFRMLGIPVGQVVASPSCRARQTAEFAFGKVGLVEEAVLHPTARREPDHDMLAAQLRQMLMETRIPDGTNLVVSGHGGTLDMYGRRVVDSQDIADFQVEETGFVILERRDGKLHAAAKFGSIKDLFVNAFVLPAQQ